MQFRSHDTDPKLTIATYQDDAEAQKVFDEVYPDNPRERLLLFLGLTVGIEVSNDPNFTRLDDGRIEMIHRTKRLARFAGRVTKESTLRLDHQPAELYAGYKDRQVLGNAIIKYITDRTEAIPTQPKYVPKEPTPVEKARTEEFNTIRQPFRKTLMTGLFAFLGGAAVAVSGRFVEVFSNTSLDDHINETVRRIGNDMSIGGVAILGLGTALTIGIFRGHERNAQGFNDGWAAAERRLDPDGLIEASIEEKDRSIQSTTQ